MTVAAAAPDKSCGDYGLRCKVMQIAALGKPPARGAVIAGSARAAPSMPASPA